jgi:hypothetical protein
MKQILKKVGSFIYWTYDDLSMSIWFLPVAAVFITGFFYLLFIKIL